MTFLQCLVVIASMSSVLSLATTRKLIKREATGECYQRDVKGNCECCEKNYRGPKCEHHCETCRTINTSTMCEYLCQGGYYGPTCASKCPESCREGNKGIPICTGKNGSFDCTNGCKEGLFGQQCNNQCSVNCRNNICYKIGGACDGCKDNYYGENCDNKCMNCVDGCFQNGTCRGGCKEGYKGPMCDTKCLTSCEECNDTCYRQCQDTCPKTVMEICIQNSTCIYSCSGNHELLHICQKNTSPPVMLGLAEGPSVLAIVLPIVAVIVVIAVLIVVCYYKKKRGRRYNTRSTRNEEHNDTDGNLIDDTAGENATRETLTELVNKFNEIKRSTTNLEKIELPDVSRDGSQVNSDIAVITESQEGENSNQIEIDLSKNSLIDENHEIDA